MTHVCVRNNRQEALVSLAFLGGDLLDLVLITFTFAFGLFVDPSLPILISRAIIVGEH